MKKVFWTKLFYFSASFSRGPEIHGHNYTLIATLHYSGKFDEAAIEQKIKKSIIDKIHSRDLGLDVDFLRGTKITDFNLLKIFSKIIAGEIKPARLAGLSLERDKNTRLSMGAAE